MKNRVYIFDTTLRDGEQVPGSQLNGVEKLEIARLLEQLGVDIIEAGFPISSPDDLKAVSGVAKNIKGATIAALARALDRDIDVAYEAVRQAMSPRIHTFISTSDIHLKYQIKKSRDEIVEMTRRAVRRARGYVSDVEFSAMDASRSDPDYLVKVFKVAVEEGATTLNIPDTVGYAIPTDFGALVAHVRRNIPQVDTGDVILSVHCQNDLGLATANTIAGVEAGARQTEVTINGVGERAGNTSLEEVVMILKTNKSLNYETRINSKKIYPASRLVSSLMHIPIQPNKAIVGRNAFAHSSGIHQHGILNKRENFEIINPEDVGIPQSSLILTARSGRAALKHRLTKLGFEFDKAGLEGVYADFLKLADRKKEINDEDLLILVGQKAASGGAALISLDVRCGTGEDSAEITLKIKGKTQTAKVVGNGPVDATYRAIDKLVKKKVRLDEYLVQAVTSGSDDLGKVHVQIESNGQIYYGFAADTDVVVASARAYLDALNKIK